MSQHLLVGICVRSSLYKRFDGPLRTFDGLLRDTLMKEMDKSGLKLHPNSTPAAIEKDEKTGLLSLSLASGEVSQPKSQLVSFEQLGPA